MILLPIQAGLVARHADKDGRGRFTMNAVEVQVTDGGKAFRASGTDTKTLVVVSGPAVEHEEYDHPAVAAGPNGATAALVPAGLWAGLFAEADKKTKKGWPRPARAVAVQLGERTATLGYRDAENATAQAVTLMDGRFPRRPTSWR